MPKFMSDLKMISLVPGCSREFGGLGIVVSALAFHAGDWVQFPGWANLQINFFSFFSFSSCHNHQTFLFRLATFKITQILSPESASERKVMSTKEPFIWVNLYSLDLSYSFGTFPKQKSWF